MRRPPPRSRPVPAPAPAAVVRFSCPCGAALKIPVDRVGGHGICPKCRRRLQLGSRAKSGDTRKIRPRELGNKDDHSGKTFLLEEPFRIEDHFKEMAAPPVRLPFRCPCGRKLATSSSNADKKARCPHCGARLLLVGKTHPRSGKMEIHPLALEVPSSGDTMVLDA
jgi:DNA-directed RNA polymerase subunit RPC12/RpoP